MKYSELMLLERCEEMTTCAYKPVEFHKIFGNLACVQTLAQNYVKTSNPLFSVGPAPQGPRGRRVLHHQPR